MMPLALREAWCIARKSSVRKLYNAYRLRRSYERSRKLGKSLHQGLPLSLSIEPTTACNLRCPECISGLRSFTRPTGMLQKQILKAVLDELDEYLLYLNFYFQGEPFLNPSFLEQVGEAAQRGIFTSTSTNGHYLNSEMAEAVVRSGLDKLIISLDGTTQETYAQYRVGGQIDKVLEGTRQIIEAKRRLRSASPLVVWQFLVVRPNEHQIEEARQMARKLGVDGIVFKTAQIYDYAQGSPLIPTNTRYSRYRPLGNGQYALKNALDDHCWRMWSSCVITWDGRVVPCCFDKDAQHSLGKLPQESFRSLWQGEAYNHFRQLILSNRSQIDICQNCTEGSKVWA
jgi:radical SAM protein with 4Fe4S-binding SPASM domain